MRSFILPILVLVSSLAFVNCSNSSTNQKQEARVTDISVEKFNELMTSKPGIVLDVRTPGEVAQGKVKGATVIDITQGNFNEKAAELDKTKPIYVYCKMGGRSANASQKLIDMGYTQVYNVEGGITAWNAKGFPTE